MGNNTKKGFAIGTILLAVILIAAVVSAIAVASRGSGTQSEREKSRLAASAIIGQATAYKAALDRVIATGTHRTQLVLHTYSASYNATTDASFLPDCTADVSPNICLYTKPDAVISAQQLSNEYFDAQGGANGKWLLFHLSNITGAAAFSNRLSIIAVSGLKKPICQHLNNMLLGTDLGAEPRQYNALQFSIRRNSTLFGASGRETIDASDGNLLQTDVGAGECISNDPAFPLLGGQAYYSFYMSLANSP